MRLLSHSVMLLVSSGLLALASCSDTQGNEQAKTSAAQAVSQRAAQGHVLNVDTSVSKVLWTGSKLIGSAHSGFAPIAEGQVSVAGDQVSGGKIVIDLKGLQPTDQDAESNGKLKAHLSSSDFFSVDSFPTATFEITKVEKGAEQSVNATPDSGKDAKAAGIKSNTTITGNMTIKGIAKSITFPAEIHADSSSVSFTAAFAIDRTNWGITYGSENSIRDKIISKNIDFQINIKAGK